MIEQTQALQRNQAFLGGLSRQDMSRNKALFTSRKSGEIALIVDLRFEHHLKELTSLVDFQAEYSLQTKLPDGAMLGRTVVAFPIVLGDGTKVAVKMKRKDASEHWLDGINTYRAFETLRREGVECVDTLLATENVVIAKWSDDELVSPEDPDWIEHVAFLKSVQQKLINGLLDGTRNDWEFDWQIDYWSPDNYRKLRDGRFIAIDPVISILEI